MNIWVGSSPFMRRVKMLGCTPAAYMLHARCTLLVVPFEGNVDGAVMTAKAWKRLLSVYNRQKDGASHAGRRRRRARVGSVWNIPRCAPDKASNAKTCRRDGLARP